MAVDKQSGEEELKLKVEEIVEYLDEDGNGKMDPPEVLGAAKARVLLLCSQTLPWITLVTTMIGPNRVQAASAAPLVPNVHPLQPL